MAMPPVDNLKLKEFFKWYCRKEAGVGSGSTADAIRKELATGQMIKGKNHLKKGEDSKTFLENWLKNNQNASLKDRSAAENVLLDLKDTLGEKPWYSKTTVPK